MNIFYKGKQHIENIKKSILQEQQPRSQALPSCGGKTLAGAGHVTRGNLIAQGGEGKVSNYMLPLPHFILRLQGVRVFCTINFENNIKFKNSLNLVPVCF
jgi:hypothetical protein